MMSLFTEAADRAKAMGVFGFVASGGGSIGVLLGGVLTDVLSWHWIFLVNVPVGVLVVVLTMKLVPGAGGIGEARRLDVAGAVTVTVALMLAVYAIVNGNENGWTSAQTLGVLGAAIGLFGIFVLLESRVHSPLMPLRLFRLHNLVVSNIVGILWSAAMFAWFFMSALYLQLVLGYSPLQVGLAFLPGNVIMGILSVGLSAKLVIRYGYRLPLATGLTLAAIGLLLFARAPVDGTFVVDVLPSMILLGLGAGIAFNPVLLAAMSDVEPQRGGARVGRRQHRVHDGRRARARRARQPRGCPHARRLARGTDHRLPRRVPGRRSVRPGRGRDRRHAAPRGGARAGARRRGCDRRPACDCTRLKRRL